ncbi:MAG TPA: 2-octaprenyl-6-methoxyphenyl hydroxylase [Methylophilaceae bacterium]|nr:2-octaprenyl-6-methoxyphenyl hydroxylase [Methylophilaceae bacterium]
MRENIVIVGGGPVGVTLALALAQADVKATLLEARARGAFYPDGRALALSYGTKMILERLGVWAQVAPKVTPINTIHISQKGSFGRTVLKAQEHALPSLGYVVSYGALSAALDERLATTDTQVLYETEVIAIEPHATSAEIRYQARGQAHVISTALAILADGGRSLNDIAGLKREIKEYGHDALVAKVQAECPHDNIAYERFTPQGPMALLPNGSEFSLVWTGSSAEIQPLLALDDAAFLAKLHAHFGDRVGKFVKVGKRMTFPLRLATLNSTVVPHLAVIGNAAQTMHPVAGQGFNVGLRDAWTLAQHIASHPHQAIGGEAMLRIYAEARAKDTKRGLEFTDFLVSLFSNDLLGMHILRSKGLALLDMVKPAKNLVVEKMSYGK